MKLTEPIICSANDLASVLEDLRQRGQFIEALDTRVGSKNGHYRVSYFERVRSMDPLPKAVTEKPSNGRDSGCGETPIALTNLSVPLPAEPRKTAARDGGPKCGEAQGGIRSCVTDTLAADKTPSIEARLSALQSKLAGAGKLKRTKAARLPYVD